MAYFPVKARSELVMPTNCSVGLACESTARFHDASPASYRPALSPTRGSGLGSPTDMLRAGTPDDGATDDDCSADDVVDGAHAPANPTPSANASDISEAARVRAAGRCCGYSSAMGNSSGGAECCSGIAGSGVSGGGIVQDQRSEHALHASDFGRLIHVDVGRQLERQLVLCRAVRVEQILHHGDRAGVVLDHELEKEPVEVRPARRVELRHLCVGEHARHQHLLLD